MTEKGVAFESINYTEQRLSAKELKDLLHSGGLRPQDALRTNEPAYGRHVAGRKLSDDELIHVMAQHPELIQRPIVVRDGKSVLARPAEKLAELGIK